MVRASSWAGAPEGGTPFPVHGDTVSKSRRRQKNHSLEGAPGVPLLTVSSGRPHTARRGRSCCPHCVQRGTATVRACLGSTPSPPRASDLRLVSLSQFCC